jgi:hypothetical protein
MFQSVPRCVISYFIHSLPYIFRFSYPVHLTYYGLSNYRNKLSEKNKPNKSEQTKAVSGLRNSVWTGNEHSALCNTWHGMRIAYPGLLRDRGSTYHMLSTQDELKLLSHINFVSLCTNKCSLHFGMFLDLRHFNKSTSVTYRTWKSTHSLVTAPQTPSSLLFLFHFNDTLV